VAVKQPIDVPDHEPDVIDSLFYVPDAHAYWHTFVGHLGADVIEGRE
jgi:hypothetical protein